MSEIYRSYDSYGPILVTEDSNKRYLSFGSGDEQSCVSKITPEIPQYQFIRAMLMPLVYIEPVKILSFGLGAGSLASALYHAYPNATQDVVELRKEVIDLAYRYFYLPRAPRLSIWEQDAGEYLRLTELSHYDLVVSDLYTDKGAVELQKQDHFLDACVTRLKPEGWLVINAWSEHRGDELLERLSDRLDYLFSCSTVDGNWVLLGTNYFSDLSQSQMKDRMRLLSDRLGFSFGPVVKRLSRLK